MSMLQIPEVKVGLTKTNARGATLRTSFGGTLQAPLWGVKSIPRPLGEVFYFSERSSFRAPDGTFLAVVNVNSTTLTGFPSIVFCGFVAQSRVLSRGELTRSAL